MSTGERAFSPRKRPVQARSRQTLDDLLEGAARVFRAEGFAATTNRIAEAAGVGIGTLYEYFPNKQALLVALAERHLAFAETGIHAAITAEEQPSTCLAALQAAIVGSHRYPSHAIDLIADPDAASALRSRARALRERVMTHLLARARSMGKPDPEVRARIIFALIGELSSQLCYELAHSSEREKSAQYLLELAITQLAE